jgi:hypothetical protein
MKEAALKAWRTRWMRESDRLERKLQRELRGLTSAIYNPVDFAATGGRSKSTRFVPDHLVPRNRDGSVAIARMPVGEYRELSDRETAAALAPRRTGRENARRHVEQIVYDVAAGKTSDLVALDGLLTIEKARELDELTDRIANLRDRINQSIEACEPWLVGL